MKPVVHIIQHIHKLIRINEDKVDSKVIADLNAILNILYKLPLEILDNE